MDDFIQSQACAWGKVWDELKKVLDPEDWQRLIKENRRGVDTAIAAIRFLAERKNAP